MAATTTESALFEPRICASASSPTVSSTTFKSSVTMKMKTVTWAVCLSALFTMEAPAWS